MSKVRFIGDKDAAEKTVGASVVREYFTHQVPNLGLATAILRGTYPPKGEGKWAVNESVDEMYFVMSGTAIIEFEDDKVFNLKKHCGVHIPRGMKYHVVDAVDLNIVVCTGPAWHLEQHKWMEK